MKKLNESTKMKHYNQESIKNISNLLSTYLTPINQAKNLKQHSIIFNITENLIMLGFYIKLLEISNTNIKLKTSWTDMNKIDPTTELMRYF